MNRNIFNFKNITKNLSQGLIIEFIKYLLIYLIINGGVYLILDQIAVHLDTLKNKWVLWVILILVAVLIFIVLFKKFNKNIPYFPAINSDFQVLELKTTHYVKSKSVYMHRREYKLKAKRNGLGRYRGRFSWTGDSFKIKSGDKKHNVFLSKKVNVFDTYIIDFDRSYKKNEVIEAAVEWELFGEGSPFISCQIEEPTNMLILSVEFNNSLKINDVEFEETYIQAAKSVLNYNKIELQNYCASQTINNPKLLHLYELRWKW